MRTPARSPRVPRRLRLPSRQRRSRPDPPLPDPGSHVLALVVPRADIHALGVHQLTAAVRALPPESLALAGIATVVAYAVLPAYDALALRYVGRSLGARRTMFASIIAYGFSQAVGLAALTGASIRYRFWTAWGLTAGEIARGVAFTTTTLWLGVATVGGVACLFVAQPADPSGVLSAALARALGVAFLAVPVAYLIWNAR